jgi:hypothetical protein
MPAVCHLRAAPQAMLNAQRVIAYRAALALDEAAAHPEPATRERAGRLAALLTPVVKALLTHEGFAGAVAAQQVFGRYAYTRDMGLSHTLMAWAWAAQARAAAGHPDRDFAQEQRALARYGVQWRLPQATVQGQRVRSGAAMALPVLAT